MRRVVLSDNAQNTLENYFLNFYGGYFTDMPQRAYHYRRIISILTNIDLFLEDVYVINDKNYILVDDICVVEFEIKETPQVVISNIHFNNDITQQQKYN